MHRSYLKWFTPPIVKCDAIVNVEQQNRMQWFAKPFQPKCKYRLQSWFVR